MIYIYIFQNHSLLNNTTPNWARWDGFCDYKQRRLCISLTISLDFNLYIHDEPQILCADFYPFWESGRFGSVWVTGNSHHQKPHANFKWLKQKVNNKMFVSIIHYDRKHPKDHLDIVYFNRQKSAVPPAFSRMPAGKIFTKHCYPIDITTY